MGIGKRNRDGFGSGCSWSQGEGSAISHDILSEILSFIWAEAGLFCEAIIGDIGIYKTKFIGHRNLFFVFYRDYESCSKASGDFKRYVMCLFRSGKESEFWKTDHDLIRIQKSQGKGKNSYSSEYYMTYFCSWHIHSNLSVKINTRIKYTHEILFCHFFKKNGVF